MHWFVVHAYSLIVRTYSTAVDGITLPFGDPAGDRLGPYQNDVVSPAITLSTTFPFYGQNEDTIYVSDVHVHVQGSNMLHIIAIIMTMKSVAMCVVCIVFT